MENKLTIGRKVFSVKGAPSGRELRYVEVDLNLKSRRLLPPLSRSPFLPEEGFDLVPLKRVYVAVAWLTGQ